LCHILTFKPVIGCQDKNASHPVCEIIM